MKTSKIPVIFSLVALAFFVIPLIYLFYGAWLFGGVVSLKQISSAGQYVVNTLEVGVATALLGTALGSIYAWFLSRTDVPGRRILGPIPLLALTMPLLIKGFGWIFLLSPQIGILNVALMHLFGLKAAPFDIFSEAGIIFAQGVGSMPLAYLVTRPALDSYDSSLEEASRIGGNNSLQTFFRVTLRGIFPALSSTFLIIFISSMSILDYQLLLGGPIRFDTLATIVDYYVNGTAEPQYGYAASLSIIYILTTLALVSVYIWVTRKSFRYSVMTGKSTRHIVNKLGKWRYPALALCLGIFSLAFVFPASMLLFMSFTRGFSVIHGHIILTWTTANYSQILRAPEYISSIINSILFAVSAAVLTTFVGLILAYGFLKTHVKGSTWLGYVIYLPLAIPGIVYGLALLWTFVFLPGVSNVIYGTIWPMVLAVSFIYLPKSATIISSNLVQVSSELEESGRVNGLKWGTTIRKIIIPLISGGLINSIMYVILDSIEELGGVILLTTANVSVVDVVLLNLWENQSVSLGVLSAGALIVTAITSAILFTAEVLRWKKFGRVTRTAPTAAALGAPVAAPIPLATALQSDVALKSVGLVSFKEYSS
jgi:iron(III) transport system permease protein